jgi:uncharacterized protein (TIGR01777 family)
MNVVLTGASGLIGPALRDSLVADGHSVRTLVRHETSDPAQDQWDPGKGLMDPGVLDGVDVVVCLSGAGVGDHRWTDSYKQMIVSSRVDSVGTVAKTMAGAGSSAKLVSASAVGYYGDTSDAVVDEQAPAGKSFLADVCVKWEGAAEPAQAAGVAVSFLRTGLVLAKDGGLLKRLVPLVKAGIGGKLGSGRQYMPWISLTDEIAAIRFVMDHDVVGAVNLTGPAPVRNAELTKALGKVLHRPTVFPVPGFGARIVLGEFAGDVLTGQKALPAKLLGAGFEFAHTTVESALRAELGR